ncbi:hypothetical protein GCM10023349_28050 [Nocardioides conyzicola]|uniref:Uncharacterized protein n=1 Tax=Nocardioides conyzicola TaxID=1651781 RepID=A0ABP8XGV0_9ACTN
MTLRVPFGGFFSDTVLPSEQAASAAATAGSMRRVRRRMVVVRREARSRLVRAELLGHFVNSWGTAEPEKLRDTRLTGYP